MKKIFMLAVLKCIFLPILCYAQSASISSGAAWLSANQNYDGSWGTQVDLDLICTAETVNALASSGSGNSSAINWLSSENVISTDEVSRTIISLATSGTDSTTLLTCLINYKNSDGGWGYEQGNISDSLDTALALQALKAANYSDTALIGQSLNYLTSKQNSDGGWGFISGDTSNTYVTALVLKTLSQNSLTFLIQESINKASSYLLTKQNADGGFGSSPSTVYETALSIISLIESGQGTTQDLQNAINYLTSTQLTDGSWNDDPYSTALALQALAAARPNLTTSNLTLSKAMPRESETITITANVGNIGLDDASNVIVRFYLGDPAAGGSSIGADQIIPSLTPNSSTPVSITASFNGTGGKTIFAVVDPDNLVSETSEADNKASTRLWVATAPDLAVYSEDLKPSTYIPSIGTAFTLSYTVRNLGESAADAFIVSLYDGDPNQGGTLLSTENISGLGGTEIRTGAFGVTLTINGNHTLYLVADSGSQITEISESNNTGFLTVNVGGTQTQADLAISPADITLTPSRPHAGDTVQISANVKNTGAEAANNFTVEIFDGQPASGGTLLSSQALSLVAGGTQTITTTWAIPAGIHDVYIVADRTNQTNEANETNNAVSVRIMTDMVDIALSATDLTFTPAHPVSGDSVVLSITLHNTGIKDTGAFTFAVYDGDPAAGGTLLQTYPISNIPGDGNTSVSYAFTAVPWTYRFYAIADTENAVTEMYEDNNQAIRSLKIKSPGETLGPDLVPVKIDLSDATTDTQTLSISGTAHVTFQNKGDDKIIAPFNAIIFEDKDGDGQYTAGVDNLLGIGLVSFGTTTITPSALWPEGVGTVDVPLSGKVQFLHSPLYAFIDSGDAILEQDEANNLLVSCKDCQVVPANPIQASVKWTWGLPTGYWLMYAPPTIMYLRDTNGDGKIDQNDIPDIVLVTLYDGRTYGGKIWAFKGDTGENYFSLYDLNHPVDTLSYLSSGDIDGDGNPEIIFRSQKGGLLLYNNDWTLRWDNTDQINAWTTTHPNSPAISSQRNVTALADLYQNGYKQIISGPAVINPDGTVHCSKNKTTAGSSTGSFGIFSALLYNFAAVADLNLDGQQEIIAGNAAYDNNCNKLWWNSSLPDGAVAVGNFDGDPYPEIVLEGRTSTGDAAVYLLDNNGNIKWGPVSIKQLLGPSTASFNASQPIVADFDGDGKPEIGIRSYNKIFILNKDGELKNTLTIPAYTSSSYDGSGPTVFDVDGDGIPEVMINSGGYFTVLSGKDGTILFQDAFGGRIDPQNVIVADVDGDGQVELVVVGHTSSNLDAIRVYHSDNSNHVWSNGRRIWNQLSYHVTNINDDGSIPQHEAPNWMLNNNFMTQAPIGWNPNPYLTPNLTASYFRAEQQGLSVNLAVRVGNGGAIASPDSVTVTFYEGDPANGGTAIGTASTTRTLNPGDYQDVVYSWTGGALGLHHIYAVVDAANAIPECREDDNKANADFAIQVEYADLKISAEDIALPAGPYYEGAIIPVSVSVKNIGGLAASNAVVRMYNGNPSTGSGQVPGGTQVGADQTISGINAGSSASLTFNFDTLSKSGTNILYIVVDPDNTIAESSETNNSASVTLQVQPPVLPDLTIGAGDLSLTPASPSEGNAVTITATIHNQGTVVGNIPVSFYLGNPASGGMLVSSQIIYPVLAFNSATTVQATIDTTGRAGQQQLYVMIDPSNTIAESRKDNDSATVSFLVQSAGLTSSLVLDKADYQANDAVTTTITASNSTGVTRTLSLNLYVKDTSGNLITTVAAAASVNIGPNSSATITRTWNTGKTLEGSYTMTAELSENGLIVSRTSCAFTITPDKRISASITTDKMQYGVNDTASLTAVITSQSQNFIYQNLSVLITISDQYGNILFTDRRSIANLMPQAVFNIKDNWSVSTNLPASYTATLTVLDSSGTSIGNSSTSFTILGTSASGAGLLGTITASLASVKQNADENITFTMTNNGNEAITSLTARVLIVDPDTQQALQTYDSTAGLPLNQTVQGSASALTAGLLPRVYLAVLQAVTPAMAQPKTLDSTSFTVLDGIAPVVTIVSPESNGIYSMLTITAQATDNFSGVNNVQFQIDSGAWQPLPLADPAQGLYATAWTPAPGDNSGHMINFMATDNAGNPSTPVGVSFTIDTTPPVLSLSTLPDGSYTNNATLNIAGTATDNAAMRAVTINNTTCTLNPGGTFSQAVSLMTGTNIVTTVATDTAGNTTTDNRTITLDQTAPVITITSPNDNSITNSVTSMVTGTVDKAVAALSMAINSDAPLSLATDENNSFSHPVTLIYGQNTVQITATDLAGNIGTAKRTVTLDNQNPALSVTYPAEDMTTNQNQITLTGQVSDLTPVSITITVDDKVYTPTVVNANFSQTINFTVQKTYQINVTAVDEAGNQSLVQRNVIYSAIPQNLGVFGATAVSMSGGYVDSYDSTQGVYDGTHGTNVSVGTNSTANGAMNLSGGAVDYGDAYVGPGGNTATGITTSGGALIYGTKGILSMLKSITPVSDPGGGTPVTFTNGTTLTTGTYRVSSISLSGSGIGTIDGNVTLYVTGSLSLSGSSQLVILPAGSLTIYLSDNLNVSGGAIVNKTLNPHNLTLYGTSTCTTATYSGSSAYYGVIYAPAAKTTVSGGNVYGSVIGGSVTISGGAAVHYDESLGNAGN